MDFNGREMTAIIKLAKAMVLVDGEIDRMEVNVMSIESLRFGVQPDDFRKLLAASDQMSSKEAFGLVSDMSLEKKTYVTAYLGVIIAADGEIDDKELTLWKLVTALCDLPEMTIDDALDYLRNM